MNIAATPTRSWISRAFVIAVFTVLSLVVATLCVFLFRPALEPSQLAGSYHCDYPHGVERLTLHSDRTCTQSYTPNSGRTVVHKCTWNMNLDGELVLHNAMDFDTGFGTPQTRPALTIWIMSIRRDVLGRVFFTVNEDLGFEFRPQ